MNVYPWTHHSGPLACSCAVCRPLWLPLPPARGARTAMPLLLPVLDELRGHPARLAR